MATGRMGMGGRVFVVRGNRFRPRGLALQALPSQRSTGSRLPELLGAAVQIAGRAAGLMPAGEHPVVAGGDARAQFRQATLAWQQAPASQDFTNVDVRNSRVRSYAACTARKSEYHR